VKETTKEGKVNWVKKAMTLKAPSFTNLKTLSVEKAKKLPLEEKKMWFDMKC